MTMKNHRTLFIILLSLVNCCSQAHLLPSIHQNEATWNRQSKAERGVGCGTMVLQPGQIVSIQSHNFGVGNYYIKDGCEWKFTATEGSPSIRCPCFEIPYSFECLGDYLRISDTAHYHQKFCGENFPTGVYRSGSSKLNIRFKSDFKETARGFRCFIFSSQAGIADPTLPDISANCTGFFHL